MIVAGVVAVVLIAYVAYRVVQSRQPEAPVLMKTSTAPPLRDPEETARQNVPRIEADQLLAELKAGSVTIIDVRDRDAFAAEHIPGARSMPLAQIESLVSELPKDKPIVAYCT